MRSGESVLVVWRSLVYYADDAVLLTDWDLENANRIVHIMRCFFLTPDLKIILLTSKLIGVGVSFS